MNNLNQNNRVDQENTAFFNTSNYEGMHAISPEERQEILDSIEEALEQERESSGDGALSKGSGSGSGSMGAQKYSARLPIWMNIGALLLVGVSSLLIWKFFGEQRASVSLASTGIVSTEGLIVERLREEAQIELDAKNKEFEEIRERLEDIKSVRLELEKEIEQRLAMQEEKLRSEFQDVLETERIRLVSVGISGDQLKRDLVDYEAAMREEMEIKLAEFKARLENEYRNRIAELDTRYDLYEVQISNYDTELGRLEAEVESLKSEIQSLGRGEDSEALQTLEELQARREGEDGIRAQIAAFYARVGENWQENNPTTTIESLDSLEAFLNEPGIRGSEVVRSNRSVNNFFITAVRRLVNLEETLNEMGVKLLIDEELVFGPEDLELARNEALAKTDILLRALDRLKNNYAAAYDVALENNRDSSARITSLLSDKLRIKSDLGPSAYALLDSLVESASVLEVDEIREQIYGEFLEEIDEVRLELEP